MEEKPVLCKCGCGMPAPICKVNNKAKGLVKGQPRDYIKGHYIKLLDRGKKHPWRVWHE